MPEKSFFSDRYETIRKMLNAIYTYGCYDVDQISQCIGVKSSKYNQDLRFLRYIWPNLAKNKNTRGKYVNYFPFDRYMDSENYLWHSYQLCAFKTQDINLFFLLLSEINSEDTGPIGAYDLIGDLDEIFGCYDNIKHRNMIENKLRELKSWGMLVSKDTQNKGQKYIIAHNVLEDFSDDELLTVYDLLFLFRDVLPLSSLGYMLQQEIADYLRLVREYNDKLNVRTFLTKDIFLQNIINDEVLYGLYHAMEQNRQIHCVRGQMEIDGFSPWRFIFNRQDGRQYVWGVIKEQEAIYRLDQISYICLKEEARDHLPEELEQALDTMWSAATTKQPNEHHTIIFDFHIGNLADERRIKYFCTQSSIVTVIWQKSDSWRFQVKLRDAREMLPWIRSFTPNLSIVFCDDPQIVEYLHQEWQTMLDIYDGKKEFSSIGQFSVHQNEQDADSSYLRLFPEYRNIYYSAIREVYYRMLLDGETFDRVSLDQAIYLRTGIQNIKSIKKDKFRQEVSQFGGQIKKLSLFCQNEKGELMPSFQIDNEVPPILLSLMEKRYLHTLLKQKLIIQLLGKERSEKICEGLKDSPAYSWGSMLIERGMQKDDDLIIPENFDKIRVIRQAIAKGSCLSYQNSTQGKIYEGVCKPYRIMYSAKMKKLQLITVTQPEGEKEERLVLMNLSSLSKLQPVNDSLASADVTKMLNAKRTLSIKLRLRNLPARGNSVERAFMLFSTYTKNGQMDDNGIYSMQIDAYDFELNEILEKILSLGQAVEVVSPTDLRNEVAARIRCVLHTF